MISLHSSWWDLRSPQVSHGDEVWNKASLQLAEGFGGATITHYPIQQGSRREVRTKPALHAWP